MNKHHQAAHDNSIEDPLIIDSSINNGNKNRNRDSTQIKPSTTNNSPIYKLVKSRNFVLTIFIISVAIYIIMIEGLGKGVKYSLFVANAIIFVSIKLVNK